MCPGRRALPGSIRRRRRPGRPPPTAEPSVTARRPAARPPAAAHPRTGAVAAPPAAAPCRSPPTPPARLTTRPECRASGQTRAADTPPMVPNNVANQCHQAWQTTEQFDYLRGGMSRRRFLAASGLALGGVATTGLWLQSILAPGTPVGSRHESLRIDPCTRPSFRSRSPHRFDGRPCGTRRTDPGFGAAAGVAASTVPGLSRLRARGPGRLDARAAVLLWRRRRRRGIARYHVQLSLSRLVGPTVSGLSGPTSRRPIGVTKSEVL